jgi:hypothetical protein
MSRPTHMTRDQMCRFQEQCEEMADLAVSAPSRERYKRLADGWKYISEAQAWLDGEVPPVDAEKRASEPERPTAPDITPKLVASSDAEEAQRN